MPTVGMVLVETNAAPLPSFLEPADPEPPLIRAPFYELGIGVSPMGPETGGTVTVSWFGMSYFVGGVLSSPPSFFYFLGAIICAIVDTLLEKIFLMSSFLLFGEALPDDFLP